MILGIEPLDKFDSEAITDTALKVYRRRKIELYHIIASTTDGASTMMGKNTGVLTRLNDYCHYLVKNHCAAHRLNLSTQAAFKNDAKS